MIQMVQSKRLFVTILFILCIGSTSGQRAPSDQMQRANEYDRGLASEIQRDILNNPNITPYGRDITITAEHGRVTLRGGVRTRAERQLLEEIAERHVKPDTVVNDLVVLLAE